MHGVTIPGRERVENGLALHGLHLCVTGAALGHSGGLMLAGVTFRTGLVAAQFGDVTHMIEDRRGVVEIPMAFGAGVRLVVGQAQVVTVLAGRAPAFNGGSQPFLVFDVRECHRQARTVAIDAQSLPSEGFADPHGRVLGRKRERRQQRNNYPERQQGMGGPPPELPQQACRAFRIGGQGLSRLCEGGFNDCKLFACEQVSQPARGGDRKRDQNFEQRR